MFGKFFHKEEGLSVQGSIIIASIVIALSILLGANKIASGGFVNVGTKNIGSNNPTVQTGGKVKVEERKDAARVGGGKVTIVEFSDFQCPFCQNFFNGAYKEIKEKYIDTGKVTLIYRHLPLSQIHPDAQKAAEAAECANRQGKFFSYHDMLFQKMIPISQSNPKGGGLDIASLKRYAVDLGLDTARFNTCLDNGEAKKVVEEDISLATKLGITGTPTLFVDGVKIVGAQPFPVFEQAIEEALK